MIIHLIRHGAIATENRLIGQTDLPITDAGKEQFAQDIRHLTLIECIYHSPLSRCVQSATILQSTKALQAPLIPHDGLKEIHLGDWDGQDKAFLKKEYPELFEMRGQDFAGFRTPGIASESFSQLQIRAWQTLAEITRDADAQGYREIAIVTHAGLMRCIVLKIKGWQLLREHIFSIAQEYGAIIDLRYDRNKDEFFLLKKED